LNADGSIAVSQHPSKPPQAPAWGADHCLSGDQWSKFRKYLAETPPDERRLLLSVAEIERIIGRRLPDEAGLPTWWSQCPRLGDCGEAKAWRVAGMTGHYLIELVRS
jgi:hypothetical protein